MRKFPGAAIAAIAIITSTIIVSAEAQDNGVDAVDAEVKALRELGEERRSQDWFEKAEAAKAQVNMAYTESRRSPTDGNVQGHITEYYYVAEDAYAVYATPLKVTDIRLQPGEDISGDLHIGDTARWQVSIGTTGSGNTLRHHIYVKPTQPRLLTNLIIPTNRRSYMVELSSTRSFYMPSVNWQYQAGIGRVPVPEPAVAGKDASAPGAGIDPRDLYFGYEIKKGGAKSWRPIRVFDNGIKTWLMFPDGMQHRESPILFGRSDDGKLAIVNYRVNTPFYVIDGILDEIVLKRGHKSRDEIIIRRARPKG